MGITIYSFTSTLILLALFTLLLHCWLSRNENAALVHPFVWIFVMLFPFVRLCLPMEFPFSVNIYSQVIAPAIYNVLGKSLGGIPFLTPLTGLFVIWIVRALSMFLVRYREYKTETNLYRNARYYPKERADALLRPYLQENANISQVSIRVSATISEPMIFGIRKTILLIPEIDYTDEELQVIIGHELGHFANGDIWIKWILEGLCSVFWWFPPAKLLKHHTYNCMEVRADRFAIRNRDVSKRVAYLDSLASIASRTSHCAQGKYSYPSTLFGDSSKKTLRIRFHAIKESENISAIRIKSIPLILLLLTTMFLSCAFVIRPNFQGTEYLPGEYETSYGTADIEDGKSYLVPCEGGYDLYAGRIWIGFLSDNDQPFIQDLPIREEPIE